MNINMIGPIIASTVSIGGIIFQVGKHADKLENIIGKVEAQEKKEEYINKKMCDIHDDIMKLKTDVTYIKEDIHDIKENYKRK